MNPVSHVSINLSEMAAGTYLLWKAPSDATGGGESITSAFIDGSGTITAALYTFSNQGTPAINGTITSTAFGGTLTAGVLQAATISDGWVDGDEYVGVVLSANVVDGTRLSVNYVAGK